MLTLHKYKTDKNADSIEFCPHEPNQNVFVCANYQLNNKGENCTPTRSGLILLFSVTPKNGSLELLQSLECAGVLDSKWCHNRIEGRSILGVVNAEKSIEIYELTPEVRLRLVTRIRIRADSTELLVLSLDWSTGRHPSDRPEIVCGDSAGCVHRLRFRDGALSYIDEYRAHDFECWAAAFDYHNADVVYSGGDDAVFAVRDFKAGARPVLKNKTHGAGVTSIHSNASREHLIATSSYDGFLRLWDSRNLRDCVSRLELPGTLWRLKWDPFERNRLVAACMSGGAHVVRVDNESYEAEIVGSCNEHENLVYGVDWCCLPREKVGEFREGAQYLVGSCSFYDNLLCLSVI